MQLICSYLFWPLAVIMGVEIKDANKIGSLLGTKVFVDEFVSFRQMQAMVERGDLAVSIKNIINKEIHLECNKFTYLFINIKINTNNK